jgi:hypothetical protein
MTVVAAVKTGLEIAKGVTHLLGGGLSPEDAIIKEYFGGDASKYARRLTDSQEFRHGWYNTPSGKDGYWLSAGSNEVPVGMTVADFYVSTFDPNHNNQDLQQYYKDGGFQNAPSLSTNVRDKSSLYFSTSVTHQLSSNTSIDPIGNVTAGMLSGNTGVYLGLSVLAVVILLIFARGK